MSTTGAPSGPHHAILVPGAVLPADLAYGALLEALGDEVAAVAKELELYAGDEPPPGYTLEVEVEGVLRVAEAAGFERFHLVGYSAGGAASIVFAARHPERLQSLALLEPAWAGNEGLHPAEGAVWREFERITALPPEHQHRLVKPAAEQIAAEPADLLRWKRNSSSLGTVHPNAPSRSARTPPTETLIE
jgi:pimeloyl-ACP methyl ester carboxylesterase